MYKTKTNSVAISIFSSFTSSAFFTSFLLGSNSPWRGRSSSSSVLHPSMYGFKLGGFHMLPPWNIRNSSMRYLSGDSPWCLEESVVLVKGFFCDFERGVSRFLSKVFFLIKVLRCLLESPTNSGV